MKHERLFAVVQNNPTAKPFDRMESPNYCICSRELSTQARMNFRRRGSQLGHGHSVSIEVTSYLCPDRSIGRIWFVFIPPFAESRMI